MRDQESTRLRLKENIQVDGGSGFSRGETLHPETSHDGYGATAYCKCMNIEKNEKLNSWHVFIEYQCCDIPGQNRLFIKLLRELYYMLIIHILKMF